jgi:hypothetical protein
MTTAEPASLAPFTPVHLRVALQPFRRECEEQLRLLIDAIPAEGWHAVPHAGCCVRCAPRSWRNG